MAFSGLFVFQPPLRADFVMDVTNALTQAILATDAKGDPGLSSRNYAMTHLAMYDAYMAVEQTYRQFHYMQQAMPGTSSRAAMAQAAHTVLVDLYPTQQASFDSLLTSQLGQISDGAGKE